MIEGDLLTKELIHRTERLVRISETVHASANGGNAHSKWLLEEAKCDCGQCPAPKE